MDICKSSNHQIIKLRFNHRYWWYSVEDAKILMNTGVYGIAVSSAINLSDNKEKVIKEFLSLV